MFYCYIISIPRRNQKRRRNRWMSFAIYKKSGIASNELDNWYISNQIMMSRKLRYMRTVAFVIYRHRPTKNETTRCMYIKPIIPFLVAGKTLKKKQLIIQIFFFFTSLWLHKNENLIPTKSNSRLGLSQVEVLRIFSRLKQWKPIFRTRISFSFFVHLSQPNRA